MLKRSLALSATLLLATACADTPVEPAAERGPVTAASIIDGRAGNFAFTEGTIDLTGAGPYRQSLCLARYEEPVNGNSVISDAFSNGETTFKVVENKNFLIASCKFTDTSGVYEANAEVGKITGCSVYLEDGREYFDGTGSVTAAANNDPDGADGGNVTIRCKFAKDDA
jgi:hypothetical protein